MSRKIRNAARVFQFLRKKALYARHQKIKLRIKRSHSTTGVRAHVCAGGQGHPAKKRSWEDEPVIDCSDQLNITPPESDSVDLHLDDDMTSSSSHDTPKTKKQKIEHAKAVSNQGSSMSNDARSSTEADSAIAYQEMLGDHVALHTLPVATESPENGNVVAHRSAVDLDRSTSAPMRGQKRHRSFDAGWDKGTPDHAAEAGHFKTIGLYSAGRMPTIDQINTFRAEWPKMVQRHIHQRRAQYETCKYHVYSAAARDYFESNVQQGEQYQQLVVNATREEASTLVSPTISFEDLWNVPPPEPQQLRRGCVYANLIKSKRGEFVYIGSTARGDHARMLDYEKIFAAKAKDGSLNVQRIANGCNKFVNTALQPGFEVRTRILAILPMDATKEDAQFVEGTFTDILQTLHRTQRNRHIWQAHIAAGIRQPLSDAQQPWQGLNALHQFYILRSPKSAWKVARRQGYVCSICLHRKSRDRVNWVGVDFRDNNKGGVQCLSCKDSLMHVFMQDNRRKVAGRLLDIYNPEHRIFWIQSRRTTSADCHKYRCSCCLQIHEHVKRRRARARLKGILSPFAWVCELCIEVIKRFEGQKDSATIVELCRKIAGRRQLKLRNDRKCQRCSKKLSSPGVRYEVVDGTEKIICMKCHALMVQECREDGIENAMWLECGVQASQRPIDLSQSATRSQEMAAQPRSEDRCLLCNSRRDCLPAKFRQWMVVDAERQFLACYSCVVDFRNQPKLGSPMTAEAYITHRLKLVQTTGSSTAFTSQSCAVQAVGGDCPTCGRDHSPRQFTRLILSDGTSFWMCRGCHGRLRTYLKPTRGEGRNSQHEWIQKNMAAVRDGTHKVGRNGSVLTRF